MSEISRHYPAARQEDMADIRLFVEPSANELGANTDAVGELVLAVNEAVINILREHIPHISALFLSSTYKHGHITSSTSPDEIQPVKVPCDAARNL